DHGILLRSSFSLQRQRLVSAFDTANAHFRQSPLSAQREADIRRRDGSQPDQSFFARIMALLGGYGPADGGGVPAWRIRLVLLDPRQTGRKFVLHRGSKHSDQPARRDSRKRFARLRV